MDQWLLLVVGQNVNKNYVFFMGWAIKSASVISYHLIHKKKNTEERDSHSNCSQQGLWMLLGEKAMLCWIAQHKTSATLFQHMWEKAEILSANITKTVQLAPIIIMSVIQKSYAQ